MKKPKKPKLYRATLTPHIMMWCYSLPASTLPVARKSIRGTLSGPSFKLEFVDDGRAALVPEDDVPPGSLEYYGSINYERGSLTFTLPADYLKLIVQDRLNGHQPKVRISYRKVAPDSRF